MPIAVPATTPAGFSKERSPPTCRSSWRPRSISSSPRDCKGAWHRRAGSAARARRRGDRMTAKMKRREFITLIGAAAWPLAARAQQPKKIPRIGVLWPNPPMTFDFMRQGLKDFGYVEGQNIAFEFRWAEGKLDQLPELAADLVRLQVDIIVTLAPQATLAAKQATQTIPIVFVAMGDPVASGVVPSLARPGANVTGTTRMISEMSAKHVELLKEAVPSLR